MNLRTHNQRMKKLLRQALDILAARQWDDGACLSCRCNEDEPHKDGCRIEAVFLKAVVFGLHYEPDPVETLESLGDSVESDKPKGGGSIRG